jgi:hypothetical protein
MGMQKVVALCQTRNTVLWFASLLTVGGLALGLACQPAFGSVLYTLDFSHQPDGPATNWLKDQGFILRLNAEELHPYFREERLMLQTKRQIAGGFEHQLNLPSARRIRIHWGVEHYPEGANWEHGINAVAIAVMSSFGTETINSGSLFIPNAPYFIGLFLGQKEQADKVYIGKYYTQGGRYFCAPCGIQVGETVVSDFDLAKAFSEQFSVPHFPGVSGFGFQMNTKATHGEAVAFLQKVEYLSE